MPVKFSDDCDDERFTGSFFTYVFFFFFINFVSKFGENNEKSPCFFVWIRFDDIVDLVVTSLDDAIW